MMSVTMVLLICDACYCIPQNSGGQPVKDRRHADDDDGGDPPGLKQMVLIQMKHPFYTLS